MKAMETVQDLIEEAKVRTLYWALCVFAICYLLSHTSKSMWMNLPMSLLLVSVLRILSSKVDFCWKVRSVPQQSYLSHLEKKQLPVNDPRLSSTLPQSKWKRNIGSPVVETAAHEFIDKLLQEFVVDLWYSSITSDKEAPELMHAIIMDVLGEISGRVKELNLVDLLTRDVVDVIGDHLDLFRRNQLAIGTDVMTILSTEERDERLKHHLMDSRELHPALISPECEYKVLQQLVSGVLGVVLRKSEAQCPLARCMARELVTSLVLQPIMNFACPVYINELIECLFLAAKDDETKNAGDELLANAASHEHKYSATARSTQNTGPPVGTLVASDYQGKLLEKSVAPSYHASRENTVQPRPADWARVLDAATQRRTEVLMPENLENMWSKGRNYKRKGQKSVKRRIPAPISRGSAKNSAAAASNLGEEMVTDKLCVSPGKEDTSVRLTQSSEDLNSQLPVGNMISHANGNKYGLKRSNSTSALKSQPNIKTAISGEGTVPIISEFYSPNFNKHEDHAIKAATDIVLHSDVLHASKLKCRVIGAYFEKIGSKSFAVYSIAVTDADNKTWFVKRRYRNFERLHRQLKEIPNYTLHLPPKRIFSSSTEDAFVHQRCIHLDKYLQDLLSIANVAEQHEVWDFLSVSSKNYSFGKSASVMRTLAVNVDDAVDDIVRQFKEVSDGLVRKVVGTSPSHYEASPSIYGRDLSWHEEATRKTVLRQNNVDTENSFSDNEEGGKPESHVLEEIGSVGEANGWHSDNELNIKSFPPRVIRHSKINILDYGKSHDEDPHSEMSGASEFPLATVPTTSNVLEDPIGVPPEWSPPNVSVPLLNLVDKIFQLKRRGWLRRQVFWISKQILQLVMEDAIDDFLLRQINWLRNDDVIAQGIRWIQDVLWPDGTFFMSLAKAQSNVIDSPPTQAPYQSTSHTSGSQASKVGSFEAQLEASRRASDVKKIIFDGAPTALVSLIGHKQYKRCAKDIYYFLQSTVCVKQLAYGTLELVLISVFPELRDLVIDVHKEMRAQPA